MNKEINNIINRVKIDNMKFEITDRNIKYTGYAFYSFFKKNGKKVFRSLLDIDISTVEENGISIDFKNDSDKFFKYYKSIPRLKVGEFVKGKIDV